VECSSAACRTLGARLLCVAPPNHPALWQFCDRPAVRAFQLPACDPRRLHSPESPVGRV